MTERPSFDNKLIMPSPDKTEAVLTGLIDREVAILHKKGLVEGLVVKINKSDFGYSFEIAEKSLSSENGIYFCKEPTHEVHCNQYAQAPELNEFAMTDFEQQHPTGRISRDVSVNYSKEKMKVEVPKYSNVDLLAAAIRPRGFFDDFVPKKA
ncbi:hypothetical protein JXB27_02050 [Candidatus Woesearchaeota archaeon]|nr:hypothetical protein [Candidatus Woesearchaeota archaeon]